MLPQNHQGPRHLAPFFPASSLLASSLKVTAENGCESSSHHFSVPRSRKDGEGEADIAETPLTILVPPYWPDCSHVAWCSYRGAWEMWSFVLGCP